MTIPNLPAQGSTSWYGWAQGLDTEARKVAQQVPKWQPNTAYAAGQSVLNPSGELVKRLAAGTSGAVYVAAEWSAPASATYLPAFMPEKYGAVGDGIADDYAAVQAMVAAVNAAGGGTVLFEQGKTYRLDRYVLGANGVTDVSFSGCKGLRVIGNGVKIDVKGDFDRNVAGTRAIMPMRFENCTDVMVEGFDIDGNVDQMTRTSGAAESASHLLGFYGCRRVTGMNLDLHHGSADGLYISKSGTVSSKDMTFENVTSRLNARQGLSVIYLRNATFTSCRFVDTGFSEGTYGSHAPQAGVDLEPNIAASSGQVDVDCGNLVFESCTMAGNFGQQFIGLLADRIDTVALINCTLDAGASANDKVVSLAVNGGLIQGGQIIARIPGQQPILTNFNITANVRTTVRGTQITAVDRSITHTAPARPAGSVVIENVNVTLTGTEPNPTAGRGVWLQVAGITLRNVRFFFPAALFGGAAGAGYAVSVFAAAEVLNCSFGTDLVPTTTEHFNVGFDNALAVRDTYFTNLPSQPIRPVASSIHDPAFPFSKGESSIGNRVWLGRLNNGAGQGVSLSANTAAPTVGTFKKGEIVLNTSPAAGGFLGFVCVTAGTPGIWKTFGAISA